MRWLIIILLFGFIVFQACLGINGNPLELTGSWTYNFSVNIDNTTDEYKRTLEINDNGDYIYTFDCKLANGSSYKIIDRGSITGDVARTPKLISFIRSDIKYYNNGNLDNSQSGTVNKSKNVEYNIQIINLKSYLYILDYERPVNIFSYDDGFNFSGKYIKN